MATLFGKIQLRRSISLRSSSGGKTGSSTLFATRKKKKQKNPAENLGDPQAWLKANFPKVVSKPFGERHERLWRWFGAIKPGESPRSVVEPWPRGGAKSSTGELGTAFVGMKGTRKFVLYVSETQDQADKHVQAVATLLEKLKVPRLLGRYGHSKGWKRDELRTATGFSVSAYGLDTAARGVKLDECRPDLIIFDDIDSETDTPKTIEKKIDLITTGILPAGSSDCGVLVLQNLIHEDSIMSRLVDGRADFLHDRFVAPVEPAIRGLEYELYDHPDGSRRYRITAGEPTWLGQDVAVCESQITKWGLRAFLRESQHQVHGVNGFFFDHLAVQVVDELPAGLKLKLCRAWDLAATQSGGDWTVGVLLGIASNGVVYVLDVIRHQLSSDRVRALIKRTAERDARGEVWSADEYDLRGVLVAEGELQFSFTAVRTGPVKIHLPQDPGQAGKDQAQQIGELLEGYDVRIEPVSGKKAVRARGFADKTNAGNVKYVKGAWNQPLLTEKRKFREDEEHDFDDQIDAGSDAYNEVVTETEIVFY